MPEYYATTKQVKARYGGISDMTLWRWEHNSRIGFPQPLLINGRKFYAVVELEEWERRRTLRRPTRPPDVVPSSGCCTKNADSAR